jgi:hypothetical protein
LGGWGGKCVALNIPKLEDKCLFVWINKYIMDNSFDVKELHQHCSDFCALFWLWILDFSITEFAVLLLGHIERTKSLFFISDYSEQDF